MKNALITGSGGLIGSEAVRFFSEKGFRIFGIDNDLRAYFFGQEASTRWNLARIKEEIKNYTHFSVDIRDQNKIKEIFKNQRFDLIIHTAAQPSHDWAAKEPLTDLTINTLGTSVLLENYRQYSPEAVFIFTSTNKVYGDSPNQLPFLEKETRWELPENHPYFKGIDEKMSIDNSTHSLFGVSKAAADLMVQEYGRNFGLATGIFRGGCLTGPMHSGAKLHGFLAYLAKCVATGMPYQIFGYKGKQVRDNIHSLDLINAFYHFYQKPGKGKAYNIGGSRHANISMIEAISLTEKILGKKAKVEYLEQPRKGDHIWYISDVSKFQKDYPLWHYQYNIGQIMEEICLAGHFSQKSYGASSLTFFQESKPGTVFLAGHTTAASGPVQALKLYLSSFAGSLVFAEHSLAKTNNRPWFALEDIFLNLRWFFDKRREAKIFFGVNPINGFSGWLLKLLGGRFKLIYYTIDYAPKRFANHFFNFFFHFLDRFCAKKADEVWSATEEIRQLRTKQGILDSQNLLVRSGVSKRAPVLADFQEKKEILLIDGYLSKDNLVKLSVLVLKELDRDFPGLSLKIVTGECQKEKILELAKREKVLEKIEFWENMPHQLIFKKYAEAGLALALFEVSSESPALFSDPAEIKEFLAAGLPVLASKDFNIAKEIEEKKLGKAVSNNVKDVAKAVAWFLKNPQEYRYLSQNALAYSKDLLWEKIFAQALKKAEGRKK